MIYTPYTFEEIKELAQQQASIPDLGLDGSSNGNDDDNQFFAKNIDSSGKSIPGKYLC